MRLNPATGLWFAFWLRWGLAQVGGSNAFTKSIRYIHMEKKPAYGSSLDPVVRIHNGFEAEERKFPFMAYVLSSTSENLTTATRCSASVIGAKWILTAAHCVTSRSAAFPINVVVAGKADLGEYMEKRMELSASKPVDEERMGVQERKVSRVHVHPTFSYEKARNIKDVVYFVDIALLELEKPLVLGDKVQVALLSNDSMTSEKNCTVLGWGLVDGDRETKKLMYAGPVSARTPKRSCSWIKDGPVICLEEGKAGICRGDSGSPLICDGEIWGVASFSVSLEEVAKCSNESEEFFSQVYPALEWIDQRMNGRNSGRRSSGTPAWVTIALNLLSSGLLIYHRRS